jgi:hypothetical protein
MGSVDVAATAIVKDAFSMIIAMHHRAVSVASIRVLAPVDECKAAT